MTPAHSHSAADDSRCLRRTRRGPYATSIRSASATKAVSTALSLPTSHCLRQCTPRPHKASMLGEHVASCLHNKRRSNAGHMVVKACARLPAHMGSRMKRSGVSCTYQRQPCAHLRPIRLSREPRRGSNEGRTYHRAWTIPVMPAVTAMTRERHDRSLNLPVPNLPVLLTGMRKHSNASKAHFGPQRHRQHIASIRLTAMTCVVSPAAGWRLSLVMPANAIAHSLPLERGTCPTGLPKWPVVGTFVLTDACCMYYTIRDRVTPT